MQLGIASTEVYQITAVGQHGIPTRRERHKRRPAVPQQIQVVFGPTPKDPEEIPLFMENEARRLAKEIPKIAEFPKEPEAPAKPDKTKKK